MRTPVSRPGRCRERGSVTVEFALALPAVVLVLSAVLGVAGAATAQLRAQDAARAAARAAAIGSDDASIRAVAARLGGRGVRVEVGRDATWVEVRVSTPVALGPLTSGPMRATASATAWVEP